MAHPSTTLIQPSRLVRPGLQAPTRLVDIEGLERELRETTSAEVRFDAGSRAMYATDASNYRLIPLGLVIPRTIDDVIHTVAACRHFGVPILSRGAGTSMAGQTTNVAVVIDFSKYLDGIVEVNTKDRYAWVQPGLICDDLKRATASHRLTFGPDPATHDRCTFGGMIANNACGTHAQMAGKAVDNVEELDVLLYDGTRMVVGWMTEAELDDRCARGGGEGRVYAQIRAFRRKWARLIEERYPRLPRRVSGYNLDELLPREDGRFNVARALVGTEGTCVTYLTAKVRLVDSRPERVLLVLGYPDLFRAADAVPEILASHPIALEALDDRLRQNLIRKGDPHRHYLSLLPEGNAFLVVELGADTKAEAERMARHLTTRLRLSLRPPSMKLIEDEGEERHLWSLREAGLGTTAFVPGRPDTWPGWEDSAVAPERLGGYVRDLAALFDRFGYSPAIYGHFGMGCVHCRIDFDLTTPKGIAKWKAFMDEATSLVVSYGGSLSGEHGDGQARAAYLGKMFGDEMLQAFREWKSIWDPLGRMNPGRIVDPDPIDANLRLGAGYAPEQPVTHFKFPDDHGSFARATLRCVGIGKCRRLDGQAGDHVMCPSFMVLREEKHTTRGRAHLLWEMLQQESPIDQGFRDENVKEALDLCLSCKGCKGECPVNVDIATYKAEFLSHYWEGRRRPLRTRVFGHIDRVARLASIAPGLFNLFTQVPGLDWPMKRLLGVHPHRKLPAFAPRTFKSWFFSREARNVGGPKVVLWADTFNNHFLPETAQAAVRVLETMGFHVEVPRRHLCCGRPLYDYGMLDEAKRYLKDVLETMAPYLEAGIPIVMLEPSCASVFKDELTNLFPYREDAHELRDGAVLFGDFLARPGIIDRVPRIEREALVQGHCHHESILKPKTEAELMEHMGLAARRLASGCCGMAGAFGLERDKYEVSMGAGERHLLPSVRRAKPSTFVIANGFSCREQIAHRSDRFALHLAEVVDLAMKAGPMGPEGRPTPESEIVAARKAAQRRSMKRAGAMLVGTTLLAAGAWLFAGKVFRTNGRLKRRFF